MSEADQHKLLKRQIRKYLPDAEWVDSAAFQKFAKAVSDSYGSYEKDLQLSQQAFDLADQEYYAITNKLTEEKNTREQSIETLLETIGLLEAMDNSEWGGIHQGYDKDDLITIANYLVHQAQRRREVEEELKKAMVDAQQASIAKSDFLSIMSHEIRSPIKCHHWDGSYSQKGRTTTRAD